MGVPWSLAGWLISENPIEMNDNWGYLHFRKPPYIYIYYRYIIHMYICMYIYIYRVGIKAKSQLFACNMNMLVVFQPLVFQGVTDQRHAFPCLWIN